MRALRRPGRGRNLVGIALAVTMLSMMLPSPAAAVITGSGGAPLTDDTFNQHHPEAHSGVVVWEDSRNGNVDIYAKEIVEFAVCTAAGTQSEPAISEDFIVWTDYRSGTGDIYAYELGTGTESPLCVNAAQQMAPDIYERYVVWEDLRNGNKDIYGYDLVTHTEFPVCVATGNQTGPAVWGDMFVWKDERLSVNGDIWGWDASVGGPPMPIVMSANLKTSVDICQEWVVWAEYISGNADIRAYNLSTDRARTVYAGSGTQYLPRLDADWLVFENLQPGNPDIELDRKSVV